MDSDFQFSGQKFVLTREMKEAYDRNGYIILRNVLDSEETTKLSRFLENNKDIKDNAFSVADGEGTGSKICIWGHPGNDLTGMVARSQKIAGISEQLLGGGEAFHYHTKLMMKNAHGGGRFEWHQDYGYWYQNGCLFPDMLSTMIAVDRCDKENGCLQVLRGSHKCGRVDHLFIGGQTGADPQRVAEIARRCPLDYAILNPGDALYFHCNLLHKSNKNSSDRRRWCLISAYNLKSNDAYKKHHCPNYTPLIKVPDSAIKECPDVVEDVGEKSFIDPATDQTVKADKK